MMSLYTGSSCTSMVFPVLFDSCEVALIFNLLSNSYSYFFQVRRKEAALELLMILVPCAV